MHVEDDEITLLLIRDAMSGMAELVQTSSVEEAQRLLGSESFDLVILDFTLPDGSGQALLRQLRALIDPPPVIVLSSHELVRDIPGVERVLTKGRYQMDDLIKYVKEIFGRN